MNEEMTNKERGLAVLHYMQNAERELTAAWHNAACLDSGIYRRVEGLRNKAKLLLEHFVAEGIGK